MRLVRSSTDPYLMERSELAQLEAAVDQLFAAPREGNFVDGRGRERADVGLEAGVATDECDGQHRGHAYAPELVERDLEGVARAREVVDQDHFAAGHLGRRGHDHAGYAAALAEAN